MVPGLTTHARTRMQQRGIPERAVDALLHYGRALHDHHGAQVIYFDKRSREQLARDWGRDALKVLERHLGAYAVVGSDGEIRTVGHRQKKFRHG